MTIAALFTRWGLLALGLILIAVGLVMASEPISFGWVGYAPLSQATLVGFSPQLVVMPIAAAVIVVTGVAVTAAWAGFMLGRHRPRSTPEATTEG